MQEVSIFKCLVHAFVAVLVSACTTNVERFPKFAEQAVEHKRLPLVIDVFMTRDIAGTSIGVNPKINKESLLAAIEESTKMLTERGYEVNLVRSFSGLGNDYYLDETYVVSDAWRTTGKIYEPLISQNSDDPWLTSETSDYLKQLTKIAREMNAEEGLGQAAVEAELMQSSSGELSLGTHSLAEFPLPDRLFDSFPQELVIYILVQGRYQQLGKFLAQGLLIGGISGALTGGIIVMPRGSFAITDVVAFNPKTSQIVWHARGYSEGRNSLLSSLKSALKHYPYVDGETYRQKEKRHKQELLKKYR